MVIKLLLVAASIASAEIVVFPVPNAGDIKPESVASRLEALGYYTKSFQCKSSPSECRVELPSNSTLGMTELSPVFSGATTFTQERAVRAQAVALAKKLKLGNASPAEKDALLLHLCFLLLSQDQG